MFRRDHGKFFGLCIVLERMDYTSLYVLMPYSASCISFSHVFTDGRLRESYHASIQGDTKLDSFEHESKLMTISWWTLVHFWSVSGDRGMKLQSGIWWMLLPVTRPVANLTGPC